jgi:AMP-binding enzyme
VGESGGRSELVPQVGPCLEWNPPTFRWFVGGQTNLGYNAVDCHVINGNGGRAALIYMNERDERVVLTYAQLLHQVRRISAALRGLGIGEGDRITIYMPPCPESVEARPYSLGGLAEGGDRHGPP